MLANESLAVSWVLQWNHDKIHGIREGLVVMKRFRLRSARLDIEDPTNRHLGGVSCVNGHAMPCQGQRRTRGASKYG